MRLRVLRDGEPLDPELQTAAWPHVVHGQPAGERLMASPASEEDTFSTELDVVCLLIVVSTAKAGGTVILTTDLCQ